MKIESLENGGFRLTCEEGCLEIIHCLSDDGGFLIKGDDDMLIKPCTPRQFQVLVS